MSYYPKTVTQTQKYSINKKTMRSVMRILIINKSKSPHILRKEFNNSKLLPK